MRLMVPNVIVYQPWHITIFCTVLLFVRNSSTVEISEEELFVMNKVYPMSNIERVYVLPDKRFWHIQYPEYKPVDFTHESVLGQPWADEDLTPANKHKIEGRWYQMNTNNYSRPIQQQSVFKIDNYTGRPLNPSGRTGINGRGLLGRWGPNYAAHLILTRWFRDYNGEKVTMGSSNPILEYVAVKFYGEWGPPGGFCDLNETSEETAEREFQMEALNSVNASTKHIFQNLTNHFLYKGYIDDERNTDNAWIEDHIVNAHDEIGHTYKLALSPGDRAEAVKWLVVHKDMIVSPKYKHFFKKLAKDIHKANW